MTALVFLRKPFVVHVAVEDGGVGLCRAKLAAPCFGMFGRLFMALPLAALVNFLALGADIHFQLLVLFLGHLKRETGLESNGL